MVVPRNDSRPGATVNNRRARACSDPGRASDTESASTTAQEHFIASTQARTSHMSQVDGPEWSLKSGFVDISGDIEGNGTGYNNTKVDIVGVPCPGASPLRTWMTPDESVTALAAGPQPSSSNVSDPFGLATPDRQQMWIREGIRKSISTARILLYGHRTLDDGINMAELADDLLLQLFEERQKFKQPRPLFFMCHSIGGLIVKIALVKARDDPKYHSILYDCYGLVFFGKSM